MIRIAIVEDDRHDSELLQDYLKRYERENSAHFQITVFTDGLDIISDYRAEYDIILLDIQMKHLDGMSTAEKIRKLDEDVIFIFITSTVQFAVQGYTVDALGYVLKPVPYLAFSQILHKAARQIEKKQNRFYLTLDTDGGQLLPGTFARVAPGKTDSQIRFIAGVKHRTGGCTDRSLQLQAPRKAVRIVAVRTGLQTGQDSHQKHYRIYLLHLLLFI